MPGTGTSNVNSIDENIHVIKNRNPSQEGAAANVSHEVNGHVLMYLRTHDRQLSGHDYDGNIERNRKLYELIFNSLIETITNIRNNE
ncbi:MAG: hypothetical protein Q4E41_10240 [Bacteroidales bacterium]|nr:hypothetical protein [Bacteroidales bacterium]